MVPPAPMEIDLPPRPRSHLGRADAFLAASVRGGPGAARNPRICRARSEGARDFMESPAPPGSVTIATPRSWKPRQRIGPYRLLQQIGEGGMGVVYMAEQEQPVRRKVALKIIKPGMDSSQVVARFEAERQALALMDHTEHRQGPRRRHHRHRPPLLRHGAGQRHPDHRVLRRQPPQPRERLELFVPVCRAIQHAHQKGIIHRDIKPSNVLVSLYDGLPVPKVIDFGVAKATEQRLTERTLFTQYGTLIGTLEYMSPEQAEMSALRTSTPAATSTAWACSSTSC